MDNLELNPELISLVPTPKAYKDMLLLIITDSGNSQDRVWAANELVRIQPALEKGDWIRGEEDE